MVTGPDGRAHTVSADISPCSWMYPGYGLQIRVSVDGDRSNGGSEFRNLKGKEWADLTEADFEALCEAPVILDACPTPDCKGVRIRGSRNTDPAEVLRSAERAGCRIPRKKAEEEARAAACCEACFLKYLNDGWEKKRAKAAKQTQVRLAKARAQGFSHRVLARVHPAGGGDDYQLEILSKGTPSAAQVAALLRKKGSAVVNDYSVQELPQEGHA
jgi:hypothetical protein